MIKRSRKTISGNLFILFSLLLFFQQASILNAFAFPEGRDKEETLREIKHLFFLGENNLYDGRLLLDLKDKIALTKQQEEKIEGLMLAHEAFVIRNSAEIKIKELRFAFYLKSKEGEVDRKEMAQYIREISKEKTDLIVHYMNYLLDLRELLTPEQLETLGKLREKNRRKE
jgi:hypothetical protein